MFGEILWAKTGLGVVKTLMVCIAAGVHRSCCLCPYIRGVHRIRCLCPCIRDALRPCRLCLCIRGAHRPLRPCLRDGPPASLLQNADAGLSFPHRLQGVPASSHLHRCFAFRRSFLVCPGYALRLPLRHSADGRRNRSWARQPNLSRGHLMQSLLTPCRQIPAFPAWIRLPNLRGPPVRRPLSPARCLRYARGALYLNQPRHRRPNRASCCGFLISLLPHQIHCQTHDSFVHPHSIT